jgi:plastocyanin
MRGRLARRFLPIAGLFAFIGSGALPCHGGPAPAAAQSTQPPLEVRITLREWSLLPAQISVPAGRTVRFVAQNAGFLPHALTIEGSGVFAESAAVASGETVRLDVLFSAPGIYDVYCPVNAGEHRALGQEGELRVLGGVSSLALPMTGTAAPAGSDLQSHLPAPQ